MYHSITIGDKNTFDDWHLLSPSRPLVVPPSPKTNYVDILGGNGSLDYTEALTKIPRYSDREGSWEFLVLNRGDVREFPLKSSDQTQYTWAVLYSEIMNYLHGRYFDRIILEDDPYYTYRGRVWVNEWRSSSNWSSIVLNYRLEPFKYNTKRKDIGTIEIPKRGITIGDNDQIMFSADKGTSPSTLHLKATSTVQNYGINGNAAMIRVLFRNPELGIREWFTLFGPEGNSQYQDLIDSDHNHNWFGYPYYFFDKDVAIDRCFVSNINETNTCEITAGVWTSDEVMYGPVKLECSYEEAIL